MPGSLGHLADIDMKDFILLGQAVFDSSVERNS